MSHTDARYATELLVADTITYDVISHTAKTVTLRRRVITNDGAPDLASDPGAYGLRPVHYRTESNPHGHTKTLRQRKDGTFRSATYAHPIRFSNDEPVARVDYRT